MVKRFKQYIAIMLAVMMLCGMQFGMVAQAAADDIRFDFDTGLEGASLKGATFDSIKAENGLLIASNSKSKSLSNLQAHIALPAVDFGDGGYYMHVNVKYKMSSGVTMGAHFADIFKAANDEYGTVYGTAYNQWNDFKTMTYDVTATTGVKYPRWILAFGSGSNGTATVEIESVVFSRSAKAPKAVNVEEAEYVPMYDNSDSKAVRLLVSLGIMDYDQQTNLFWDNTPMKRGQMAELLCKLYNVKIEKQAEALFDDVNESDRAAVETAVKNGYMSGYGNRQFGPDDYITGNQLLKIYTSLLGGDGAAQELGGYPAGYLKVSQLLGLRKAAVLSSVDTVTRLDVANAIYDAMHSEYLDVNSIVNGEFAFSLSKNETFMNRLGIYRVTGVMTADNVTTLTTPKTQVRQQVVINGVTMYDPNYITTGYLGYNVDVYERRTVEDTIGTVIYIEARTNNVFKMDTKDVVIDDVVGRKVYYHKDDKSKTITLAQAVDVVYNGLAENFNISRLLAATNDEITFIDYDCDNKYDVIFIYDYNDYMTDVVRTEEMEVKLQYGESTLHLADNVVRVFKDGIPVSFDNVEENQVISVAKSANVSGEKIYTIKLGTKAVTGTVDEISIHPENYRVIKVEGIEYCISPTAEALIVANKLSDVKAGDYGTFYLNDAGFVTTFKLTNSKDEVGFLITGQFVAKGFEENLAVMIYTTEGKIVKLQSEEQLRVDGVKQDVSVISQDAAYVAKLSQKQVVKYRNLGDTLVELTFAKDSYDATAFSKDVSYRNLRCNRTSILADMINGEYMAERYKAVSSTIAFKVPVEASLSDTSYYDDESLYQVLTGSSFMWRGAVAAMELYDVSEDGSFAYAIWTYTPYSNRLTPDEALAVVDKVAKTVNQDGEVVTVLYTYDESGNERNLKLRSDCVVWGGVDIDAVQPGDVVNFFTDSSGEVFQITVLRDENTQYEVKGVADSSNSYNTLFVYGRAAFVSKNQASIYTTDTRPTDAFGTEAMISNTSRAIYLCEDNGVKPVEFSEIEPDDELFAILNSANNTRILVIYR